jgi:aubergine-like protein
LEILNFSFKEFLNFLGDSKVSKEFIQCLGKVSIGMGFMLGKPKEFQIGNTRPATYIEQLKKSLELAPHMVMVVIPNNKSDAYHAIKKICCIDNPVPSQVMTGQVLNKPKGMMSVAGKVAIQMAAKMGGEPWGVQMPVIDGLMVIGKGLFIQYRFP